MNLNKPALLSELIIMTSDGLAVCTNLIQPLSEGQLNHQPNEKCWSVAQCLEHLNRYADYYHPLIDKLLNEAEKAPEANRYQTGIIGNYFANAMLPKNGKITKISAPKDKNPLYSTVLPEVVSLFELKQKELEALLNRSNDYNLGAIRVPIALNRFIKLKLGDMFRFLVYHNFRHLEQCKAIIAQL